MSSGRNAPRQKPKSLRGELETGAVGKDGYKAQHPDLVASKTLGLTDQRATGAELVLFSSISAPE